MKHTKEQLEHASRIVEGIVSSHDFDIYLKKDFSKEELQHHIDMKGIYETIQSLIQDALDPWNYNMDEAPRDHSLVLVAKQIHDGSWEKQLVRGWSVRNLQSVGWTHFKLVEDPTNSMATPTKDNKGE